MLSNVGFRGSIIEKILHFFFLYILIFLTQKIIENRKNKTVKHGIIIGLIYFVILSILLLLVWPGTWSWDDIHVVLSAQNYAIFAWQHFISSLFQIMCLQTIPIVSGIIIMQIIIASMIVGYCVSKISELIVKDDKYRIITEVILFIPAILPPVVIYLLSGYRIAMYSFVELLLITQLFVVYKESKKISFVNLLILIILTILVASWRTEGIYYLGCIFLIFLLLGRRIISLKSTIVATIFCVISVLLIGKVNNHLIGNNDYSLTATIEPIQSLIKNADIENDSAELEKIGKVLDLNMINENPGWNGPTYFWSGIVRENYTEKEYQDYLMAYLKLTLKYPQVAFKAMWKVFYNTSGLGVENGRSLQSTLVNGSINLYDQSSNGGKLWLDVNGYLKNPINKNVRESTIKFLANVDKEKNVTFMYYIFWNLFIPFVLAAIILILVLFKRKWFLGALISTVLLRIPLVFITSSTPFVMYYLSTYLIAYFIVAMLISIMLNKNERKFTRF